ncbi:hypothetical protein [Flavobacterium humi]|uniref:Uncharacterized protein n=1 Tax=Flavobacterium humi TaxID=2562683 RepID=A0A4Z0L8S5_9FLAO|nr:hypothetical protein [Flavobacterium humi]TGD58944.1 hypothetical protein E4635_03585 [Flavobacterium humi]
MNYKLVKTVRVLLCLARRCKMKEQKEDDDLINEKITEIYCDIENEKEQKLVNLLVKIIVSITLKELYEKGD